MHWDHGLQERLHAKCRWFNAFPLTIARRAYLAACEDYNSRASRDAGRREALRAPPAEPRLLANAPKLGGGGGVSREVFFGAGTLVLVLVRRAHDMCVSVLKRQPSLVMYVEAILVKFSAGPRSLC